MPSTASQPQLATASALKASSTLFLTFLELDGILNFRNPINKSMPLKLKSWWSPVIKKVDPKDLTDAESFRQILRNIQKGESQYILKDHGQSLAALLSLDDLELLKQAKLNKQKGWGRLFENLEKVHARNSHVSEEEVHADVEAAIREIRQQRA